MNKSTFEQPGGPRQIEYEFICTKDADKKPGPCQGRCNPFSKTGKLCSFALMIEKGKSSLRPLGLELEV